MKNDDKTHKNILHLLKTKGPLTAKMLATKLNLTTMGIRQHMLRLEKSGDVIFEDKKAVRGRPTRYWSLTKKSLRYFPDGHEFLTLQMIDSIKEVFGPSGLDKLIENREAESLKNYTKVLAKHDTLLKKTLALAEIRTDEGYMASIKKDKEKEVLWLNENHCSICAAAASCLNFCRSELQLFQTLLKDCALVERKEHILSGARRCSYKITPLNGFSEQ